MKNGDIEVILAPHPDKGPRGVSLTFVNRSDAPVFVDRLKAGLKGWVLRGLFVIEPEPRFVARTAKHPPPKRDDYVELAPGESVRSELTLDGVFAFEPGQTYRVGWAAALGNPDDAGLVEVTSNVISLAG